MRAPFPNPWLPTSYKLQTTLHPTLYTLHHTTQTTSYTPPDLRPRALTYNLHQSATTCISISISINLTQPSHLPPQKEHTQCTPLTFPLAPAGHKRQLRRHARGNLSPSHHQTSLPSPPSSPFHQNPTRHQPASKQITCLPQTNSPTPNRH